MLKKVKNNLEQLITEEQATQILWSTNNFNDAAINDILQDSNKIGSNFKFIHIISQMAGWVVCSLSYSGCPKSSNPMTA